MSLVSKFHVKHRKLTKAVEFLYVMSTEQKLSASSLIEVNKTTVPERKCKRNHTMHNIC